MDRLGEVVPERPEIRDVDVCPSKHGIQRSAVGKQKTFLPLDPDEVQVPVLGRSLSVSLRSPSRSNIFLVQRTTIPRSYQGLTSSSCPNFYSWSRPPSRSRRCICSGSTAAVVSVAAAVPTRSKARLSRLTGVPQMCSRKAPTFRLCDQR